MLEVGIDSIKHLRYQINSYIVEFRKTNINKRKMISHQYWMKFRMSNQPRQWQESLKMSTLVWVYRLDMQSRGESPNWRTFWEANNIGPGQICSFQTVSAIYVKCNLRMSPKLMKMLVQYQLQCRSWPDSLFMSSRTCWDIEFKVTEVYVNVLH